MDTKSTALVHRLLNQVLHIVYIHMTMPASFLHCCEISMNSKHAVNNGAELNVNTKPCHIQPCPGRRCEDVGAGPCTEGLH